MNMHEAPLSDPATSRRMSRQASRNTGPEVALRRALRALGLGYRIEAALPGLPRRRGDVMFVGAKVAVFVDGCFWHACPEHGTVPHTNTDWWKSKLAANVARDRTTDVHLKQIGWLPIRVWEHEDMQPAACRIAVAVRARRTR